MLQLVLQRPPSARKFTAYLRIAVLFTKHCFSANFRAKWRCKVDYCMNIMRSDGVALSSLKERIPGK